MDTEKEGTGANVVLDMTIAALISDVPTESTKHIINGTAAQYSTSLYGTGTNNPNDTGEAQYCQPVSARKNRGGSSSSSSSSQRQETLEEKKCDKCKKDCLTPNNLMAEKLKKCIDQMGTPEFMNSPRHFESNPFLCSNDLNEYLVNHGVLTWVPHYLYKSSLVRCWVVDCGGHLNMTRIKKRSVEAINGVTFVLYAQYQCDKCNCFKTSLDLDAMALAGFPLAVLNSCPVVPFKKSSVEKATYETLITLCSSGTAFEGFAKLVSTTRFRVYTHAASTFLQMQSIMNVEVQPLQASTGLGLSGVAILGSSQSFSPFPEYDSHCNGWGGGKSPTAGYWADVYMDATKSLKSLADAVEVSIGGMSYSHDHTFACAQKIKITIPVDQGGPMVAPIVGLSIGKLV